MTAEDGLPRRGPGLPSRLAPVEGPRERRAKAIEAKAAREKHQALLSAGTIVEDAPVDPKVEMAKARKKAKVARERKRAKLARSQEVPIGPDAQSISESIGPRKSAGIHVPSVRVQVRETGDTMSSNDGGEYFETCYEIRSTNAAEFRVQAEIIARAIGTAHDPKVTRIVAFIGIGRSR